MNQLLFIGVLIFIIQLIRFVSKQKWFMSGGWKNDQHLSIDHKKNTYIYWHIATIGSWFDIVSDQLDKLDKSGLLNQANGVYIGIINSNHIEYHKLIKLLSTSTFRNKFTILFKKSNGYENQTLNALKQFCDQLHINNPSNILYIHSKGVTRNTKPVSDWRNYMEYFLIEKYQNCLKILNHHDHCGVNWTSGIKNTWIKAHYSGNFWWATSNYIKTLPPMDIRLKFNNQRDLIDLIEFWIGRNPNGKHYSFHQSIGDQFKMLAFHYKYPFPRIIYDVV